MKNEPLCHAFRRVRDIHVETTLVSLRLSFFDNSGSIKPELQPRNAIFSVQPSQKRQKLIPPVADLQSLNRRLIPTIIREIVRLVLPLCVLRPTRSLLLILRRATGVLRTTVTITLRRNVAASSRCRGCGVGGCRLCRRRARGILKQTA